MLLIAGSIRIDPTLRDELVEAAIEVARELRKQVGCTYVAISADLEDRGLLHLLQKWESQAALTANISSPRIFAIRNQVGRLGIREMTLLKYEVAAVDPHGGGVVLVVAGSVRIDPARRDGVIEAAIALMQETRKLPGCISFVVSADLEDPGLLHVFQEWESPAAFREQLVGLGVREIAVQRYAIGSVGPIA